MKDDKIFIVFIGTSSGETSLKRFHSSLLIKSKGFNLLLDCGEGTSKAILHHKISFNSVDGILFSHLHPDHSAGFPSFIVQLKQQKRSKPLKIFCHKNLTASLKMFLRNSFVFTKKATFKLEYLEFEHNQKIEVTEVLKFISRQNSHLDKYLKYLADKENGFASSSFLFELEKKKFLYSGDLSSAKDLYIFKSYKPELLIVEATHVSMENILEYFETMKPKKIYLTHYSDQVGKALKKKIRTLPSLLSKKITLAEDGMTIRF